MNRATHRAGFTLLELSIVLVIIGLIIGGITAGAELIRSAELNSVVSDFQKYDTTMNTFKLKYNTLPGDMDNASSYWPGSNDGDGNGNISFSGFGDEDLYLWEHLSLAEMIPGSYSGALPYAIGVSIPGSSFANGAFNI